MKRAMIVLIAVLFIFGMAIWLFISLGNLQGAVKNDIQRSGVVKIVAAEDFYGDIASQLGGPKVQVASVLSNPAIDPHEYDPGVQDAVNVAQANIVIENGLNYDEWMDKLIAASPNPDRTTIIAGNIAPDMLPENPHVWYGIDNMAAVARSITDALIKVDPADRQFYETKFGLFEDSLTPIVEQMAAIKAAYGGTPVALTETIYLYQTGPMGLTVTTPLTFERAIAEGNDPSAEDVQAANAEITDHKIKVLIYNGQTVTPIITNLINAASSANIPLVSVTELMPAGDTYQSWIMNQLMALQQALAQTGQNR